MMWNNSFASLETQCTSLYQRFSMVFQMKNCVLISILFQMKNNKTTRALEWPWQHDLYTEGPRQPNTDTV